MTTPLTITTKTIEKDELLNYTVKELSDTIKKSLNNKEEIITALSELFEETEIQQQRDLQQVYLLAEKKITYEGDNDDNMIVDNNNNNNNNNNEEKEQQDKKITENVNELLPVFTLINGITEKVKQLQKKIRKLEAARRPPSPSPETSGGYINVQINNATGSETYFKIKTNTVLGKLMAAFRTRHNIKGDIGSFLHKGRVITPEQTGEELGFGSSEIVNFIDSPPTITSTTTESQI